MKLHTTNKLSRWARLFGLTLAIVLMVTAVAVSQVAPSLGNSTSFGILAAGAISGSTTVSGNVGTSTADVIPGTILAGAGWQVFAPGISSVLTAHNDFLNAYSTALTNNSGGTVLAATFPVVGVGNDALNPLPSGIYVITSPASMTADLYLSGAGIFIFKTSTTFNTTAGTVVHLAGGAVWSNIYWLVGGAVTLGAGSSVLEGNILSNSGAVVLAAPGIVHGRVLSNGAVTASTVTIGDAAIPLPVELVSFTAVASGMNAELRWTTATETNNYGFDVERKAADQWTKVGFVQGSGTSTSAKVHSFVDRGLSSGRYEYRIKQIDNNGSFKYTAAVEVEIGLAPKEFTLSQGYPNPFNPSTTVEFSVARNDQASVKVFNVLGQEVATLFDGIAEAGKLYQTRFDASHMSSGMYYVRLESNGQAKMQKMVLLK